MGDAEGSPPRRRRGLRKGYTTGACAAAAAKAAALALRDQRAVGEVESTLPIGQRVTFAVNSCEFERGRARCSVIKDAGDDPDVTHGAELFSEVRPQAEPGITLDAGPGVGRITKVGLGLPVGAPAINPVPQRMLRQAVEEVFGSTDSRGFRVTVSVPRGEEMAKKTLNERLGIAGGISILGTTGIVIPYSTAAYRDSIRQSVNVARAMGFKEFVFTTGGRSEKFAQAIYKDLREEAFIQMGDFLGFSLKQAARAGAEAVHIVGMVGKMSKMADGRFQTHAAGSQVSTELLAALAEGEGAPPAVVEEVRGANTARHVLEIAERVGLLTLPSAICRRVKEHCERHIEGKLRVTALMTDFEGKEVGRAE
ncbi:MAG: cobalt-precorrin-5B (C(1))-methyltransferase [Nitrospinota bacterium]